MAVVVPPIKTGADIVAWVQSLNFKELAYDGSWMTPEIRRSAIDNIYYRVAISDFDAAAVNSTATGSVALTRELSALVDICDNNVVVAAGHVNPPKVFTNATVTSSQNTPQEEAEISRVAALSKQLKTAILNYVKHGGRKSRKSRRGGSKHRKSKTAKRRGRR